MLKKKSRATPKPSEDPSEFLESSFKAYSCYNTDPEDPGNLRIVTMTSIEQSALDIRRKLYKSYMVHLE